MSVELQIIIAVTSIIILLGMMMALKFASRRMNISPELQRKLVHIVTGVFAITLPWVFPAKWPVYVLVGLTILVMFYLRLPNTSKQGVGSVLHSIDRKSYGDVLLAIAIGSCFYLAGDQYFLYVLPIAILALSDAIAALIGSSYGRHFYIVEDGQKSIEGSVMFFLMSLIISLITLMMMTDIPPLNILILSLMVSGFGTLIEADSWRGYDNLFLPVALLIFLATHQDSSLFELGLLIALFILSLYGFSIYTSKLGLTQHAGRVYIITLFMLFTVTAPQNVFLPILLLLSYSWHQKLTPNSSNFPQLDIAASLVLLSIGWLVFGNAFGHTAILFYGLTIMGMTMAFAVLAFAKNPKSMKYMKVIIIGTLLFFTCLILFWLTPEERRWAENLSLYSAMVILFCSLISLTFPKAFSNYQVIKVTILALIIPVAMYLFELNRVGEFL